MPLTTHAQTDYNQIGSSSQIFRLFIAKLRVQNGDMNHNWLYLFVSKASTSLVPHTTNDLVLSLTIHIITFQSGLDAPSGLPRCQGLGPRFGGRHLWRVLTSDVEGPRSEVTYILA